MRLNGLTPSRHHVGLIDQFSPIALSSNHSSIQPSRPWFLSLGLEREKERLAEIGKWACAYLKEAELPSRRLSFVKIGDD